MEEKSKRELAQKFLELPFISKRELAQRIYNDENLPINTLAQRLGRRINKGTLTNKEVNFIYKIITELGLKLEN